MVIDDGAFSRRVRRPVDFARFVVALFSIAGVLFLATVALSTFSGIDQDVADSAAKLPDVVSVALSSISGFGQFILPTTVAVHLLLRRRGVLLLEAVGAFILSAVLIAFATNAARFGSEDFWFALAGTLDRDTEPLQPLLAGVFAFITVPRLRGRMSSFAAFIVSTAIVVDVISGGFTAAALAVSALLGWAVGLAFRYAIGTPTTRPRGAAVAHALADAGFDINVLEARQSTDRGRRYAAQTTEGEKLHVVVYDRDLEGAGVLPRWWRSLRLRDDDALGGWTMREAVERSALMAYAAAAADLPLPRLKAVKAVGSDATVMAFEWVDGTALDALQDSAEISDAALTSAWKTLRDLHANGFAHRGLSTDHMLLTSNDTINLIHITSGSIPLSDLQERIDIADMAISLALVTSPERSIASARAVFADETLVRAIPALQPFALTKNNRKILRKRKEILPQLREQLAALALDGAVEDVSLERLKPRTILSLVALLIAAYVLIGQFAQVDIGKLISNANYGWVSFAAVMTLVTFLGSAMALEGFVVEKLNSWRTLLAQFAASFATLVSPPALGTVAINGRYLQKAGLPAAAAGAAVAVSQVLAFIVHIALLFVAGVAAGTTAEHSFNPPREAVIALGVFVLVTLAILPMPKVRKYIVTFARPKLEEVIPRLVMVAQRPAKMATGLGGMLILNLAFCAVLVASVRAFGGGGTIAAISLVYLAGSTLGQAAPTPGGVGAVETVMTAGLVATGIDGSVALSAVLLFRLLTFWIPTVPGWFAFHYLTRNNHL